MRRVERVLVTGSTGFIGRHVAGRLKDCFDLSAVGRQSDGALSVPGYRSTELGGELFEDLLASFRPEVIVHCAGSASVSRSQSDPSADFQAGPELLMQLYDTVRKLGQHPCIIQLSSAAVYGEPECLPVPESAPLKPLSPYGWHKQMCELIGREYSKISRIPGLALRVFSCYGAGQRKLLLWDAARKLLAGQAEFFGSGRETRDYLHVRDLAELVLLLAHNPPRTGFITLNAASGQSIRVDSLVHKLRLAMGLAHMRPVFNGRARQGDPKHWRADVGAMRALGFRPAISLNEGIQDYAYWFMSQGRHQPGADAS